MELPEQELPSSLQIERPSCLTIAGSDSGGEAGIQADLKTIHDFNCHGLTAITACTAQNRNEILSLNEVPAKTLVDQIKAVLSFFDPKHIKVGLLSSEDHLKIVGKYTEGKITVIDPVLKASSGSLFLSDNLKECFKENFFREGNTITPNFDELCWLLNVAQNCEVQTLIKKAHEAALRYKINFYVKGGHTKSPSTDFLIKPNTTVKFESKEIENTYSTHGTGCRISSAICAAMAHGIELVKACQLAKNYVYHAIESNILSNQHSLMSSPGKAENLPMKVTYQEIQL